VGDYTGLLGMTVESISWGKIGTRQWMGKQGAVAAMARRGTQGYTSFTVVSSLRYGRKQGMAGTGLIVVNSCFPDSWILFNITPYLLQNENSVSQMEQTQS